MKNFKIALILIAVIFSGCKPPIGQNRQEKEGYDIVEVDSCEYIEVKWCTGCNEGYYSLTHKGNCKYCAERNKK